MRNFDIYFSSPDRCVMVLGNTHFIPPIVYEMKAMKMETDDRVAPREN